MTTGRSLVSHAEQIDRVLCTVSSLKQVPHLDVITDVIICKDIQYVTYVKIANQQQY